MPRRAVTRVTDMEIDEVSMVDRAANTSAAIVFSKRADQEEEMPDYTGPDGQPIDLSEFEEGEIVEDAEGNRYVVSFDNDEDDDNEEDLYDDGDDEDGFVDENEGELVGVGKSAFGRSPENDAIASVREALSKAVSEEDRDRVLSKGFSVLAKRAEAAEARLAQSERIAKSERDLRLTKEYISKAADYNVPVDPEDLGPVLMRMAGTMSYEDCAVINKALTAAGNMLFTEAGYDGSGADDDPVRQIEAMLEEQVSKGDGGSSAGRMTQFFDNNPAAYDAVRADRR